MAVDDWRVAETWRLVQGRIVHGTAACAQRVVDSLAADRRRLVGRTAARPPADPLLAAVRALHRRMTGGGTKGEAHFAVPEFAELWRLLRRWNC